jgi:POT family proton-dependent oligopeptide transporter
MNNAAVQSAAMMQQPKSLYYLFLTELWERFSYYGMRALFILYMTNALLFSDEKSYLIYGTYGTLVYVTPLLGGLLADRLFGSRRCVLLGGILMALGQFSLVVPRLHFFYLGLALLIVGNGLLKPNISSLLGKMYTPDDPRRNAGFTIFYVGVNIGGFLAPLICGYIGQVYGWHYGFGMAGLGMLIGLMVFLRGSKHYEGHGLPPQRALLKARLTPRLPINHEIGVMLLILAAIPLVMTLFVYHVTGWLLMLTSPFVIGMLILIAATSSPDERRKLFALMFFMVFAMIFWSFNEQAGSSLNLFAERDIDRTLLGFTIPASMFQSVNPVVIFLLGPLFANLWPWLNRRGREPSTAVKSGLGVLQIGLGFFAFAVGAHLASIHQRASMVWLFLGYLLMTTGELCVEPIGISMVTKLSPLKYVGMMMGVWYLADGAFSNYFAAKIASLASVPAEDANVAGMGPKLFHHVFNSIGITACVAGVLILLLSPWIKQLSGEGRKSEVREQKSESEPAIC